MRKILLSVLAGAALNASAGIEVTSADMKWTVGNTWTMDVNSGVSIGDFTSSGTGVTWDLRSYAGSSTIDTVKVGEKSAGATATIKIASDIVSPTNYGPSGGSDYGMEAFDVGGTDVSFLSGSHALGFPHAESDTWTSGSSVVNITNVLSPYPSTLNGSVMATGEVVTPYGTFDALLVTETFSIPGYSITETYYYWETKEYGRIATLIDGKLSLMKNNNFSPVEVVSTEELTLESLQIFPNPSNGSFTVKANHLENVKVFDAIGNLVINQNTLANAYLVNATDLTSGVYFVKATANGQSNTQKIIVK